MVAAAPWRRAALMTVLAGAALGMAAFDRSAPDAGHVAMADCELRPPVDPPGLERCLELFPRDVELMLDLGDARERAGDRGGAEALYLRAVAVDPDDAEMHARIGRLMLLRGETAEGRRHLETALASRPYDRAILTLLEEGAILAEQVR